MNHEELMMDCIRQASIQGLRGQEARDEAAKMFALITGRSYQSVIGQPMQTTTPPKAEVVGRDGEIPKFQDYLKDN
jgi:hypothetical protein